MRHPTPTPAAPFDLISLGELFERAFHEGPFGIAVVSPDFRFLRVNEAFCRMTGYSAEELHGAPFADITHPEDASSEVELAERVIRGEIPSYQIEKRYLRKDGGVTWVRLTASATFDEKGDPRYGLGLAEEVTARKDAEERLRRSEEHFRLIAEQATDIISIDDAEGRVVYVSPAVTDVLGYAPEELFGVDTRELLHPEDAEAVRRTVDGLQASSEPGGISVSYRFRHRDGQYLWLESSARETVDLATGERRLLAVTRDVTARKKLEQVREDLVAMLSHDIRNPLSTVLGATELLHEQIHDDDATELLEIVEASTRQAARLASNFLDSARAESGALKVERSSISVNAVIEATLREQQSTARAVDVRIEAALDPALPEIPLDPVLVGRALTNLVSNAIKFSPAGGVVRVSSAEKNGHVLVEIADQGPGIAESERAHLFERYGTINGRADSIGLGLFIVRHIVEAHGGHVAARFPKSGGSLFEIALPQIAP